MYSRYMRAKRLSAVIVTATVFQLSSCSLTDVGRYLVNINPCGLLLNCDPQQYEFATSGYEGPGADPDRGIYFTTLPPFTADADDPLILPP